MKGYRSVWDVSCRAFKVNKKKQQVWKEIAMMASLTYIENFHSLRLYYFLHQLKQVHVGFQKISLFKYLPRYN